MDSTSYRNSRPPQRPSQVEPAAAPPTPPEREPEPEASHTPARPAHVTPRAKRTLSDDSKKPKRKVIIAAVVAALVLLAVGWYLFGRASGPAAAIDGSKYQAVFFTNGQVYFGKLSLQSSDYMSLKNVYYLQNKSSSNDDNSSPQSASKQDTDDVELIKLGNEIHGPEDEMLIAKDQILFFENLKPAGSVSQTITSYQTKNKR